MKTIPCDYILESFGRGSRQCEGGKVLIYGEMGGPPPEIIVCPQCKGVGTLQVPESFILQKIAELTEDRNEIDEEIEKWKAYLA